MKNEFRSTNASDTSFGTTNYGIQSGSSMGTTVAPDIAGHEARQAARRRKRNKILTVSIIICLVAVVSAFFAIYTTTDWFKATPPAPSDLVIDDDVTTPTRVAVVDREAFTEAQRLGDFSGLSGGADASLWVEPFLIGYKLVAEDDSIVKIADSKIYGWTPGITTVRVETADGQLVDTITIEVLDANGRLYYYIDFFAESTDINNDTAEPLYTLQVISGRTISFMTAELPALPSKRGYDPQYWTVGGARFFPSDTVTSDIKAYVTWAAKSVSFLSSLDGNLDNGAYKADYSVDISDYVDRQSASGSFTYTAENLPEGLTLDPSTGIIEGRPQEAGTYIFSITATDNLQSEEDRQATADTKEFTLQVAKRVAGVVISDRNLTYNGDLQTLPVQITNIAEGDTGNVIAVVNYINSEEDGVKDADTYTAKVVSLSGSRASNYTLPGTAATRTFTVAPRVAEIEFLSPTNNFRFSYDGTEKTIFARVNNLADGDVCGVELSYNGDRFNVTAEGVEATAAALTNPNYTLPSSQRTHKFYIDPASLTLTIDANQSKVYACNEPDYTFTVSGAAQDDQYEWELLVPQGISREAGETVGLYSFFFDVAAINVLPGSKGEQLMANYAVTFANPSVKFGINPRPVSLTGPITRGYNGGTDIADATYAFSAFDAQAGTGLKSGDTLVITGTYDNKEVGVGKTISVALTPNVADNNNYTLLNGSYLQGEIVVRNITAIRGIVGISRPYDGTVDAQVDISNMTIDGLLLDESVSIDYTARFIDALTADNKTITLDNIALIGDDKDNYTLASGYTVNTITADINAIVISAITGIIGLDKTYDGTDTATLDFTNAKFGTIIGGVFTELKIAADTINILTASANFVNKNVGNNIDIDIEYVDIDNSINYNLADTIDFGEVKANINKKEVKIAGTFDKVYDGTNAVNFAPDANKAFIDGNGPANGETLTYTGTYASASAGNGIAIEFVLDSPNYIIIEAPTGNIAPKSVSVTGAFDKVYDATTAIIAANLTLNGIITGDTSEVVLTGNYLAAEVGATTIEFALTGGKASNYTLTDSDIDAAITKRPIMVSIAAAGLTKEYDGEALTAPVDSSMVTGHLGNEVFVGTVSTLTETAGATKAVQMNGFGIMDNGNDVTANYTWGISGTATITKKDVSLSGNFDKVYDASDVVLVANLTIDGKISGDNITLIGRYYTGAFQYTANADTHSIDFAIGGGDAANYNLTGVYSGTIAKKELTISHTASKTYDGAPYSATINPATMVVGLLSGRSYLLTGTLTSGDKNVALDGLGAVVAKPLSLAGGSLTIYDDTDDMDVSANFSYTLTGCEATITPKELKLTAANIVANDKTYDGSTVVTGFDIVGNPEGLVTGDDVRFDGIASFNSKNAGLRQVVVDTAALQLVGNDKNNYTIDYTESVFTKNATISKKDITIKANAGASFDKTYDGNANVIASNFYVDGLVTGEAVSFTGTYGSVNASAASYAITFTLVNDSVSANYQLTGNYSGKIARRPIAVIFDASKVYDGTDSIPSAVLEPSDIVSGDTVGLESSQYEDKMAGTGKALIFVLDNDNYIIDTSYTADITKATLTVDFGTLPAHVYNTAVYTVPVTISMLTGMQTTDVLYAGAFSTEDANADIDKALVATTALKLVDSTTPSVDTTSCYNIDIVNNKATISQREIVVSGDTVYKTYDGTTAITVGLNYTLVNPGTMVKEDESLFKVAVSGGAALASKNVGSQTMTVNYEFTGANKDNYFTNTSTNLQITVEVEAREIKVIPAEGLTLADALTKIYDGSKTVAISGKVRLQSAIGQEGKIAGDDLGVTGLYDAQNVASSIGITFALNGVDAGNYTIIGDYTGKVSKRPIEYTSGGQVISKIYNGDTQAQVNLDNVTFDDVISGETVTLVAGNAVYSDKKASPNVPVTVTGLSLGGADAQNYTLVTTDISLYGAITPKEISVNAGAITKPYDGNANVLGQITLNGVLGSDTVSVSGTYQVSKLDPTPAINKADNLYVKFTLTGVDSGNYILDSDTATDTEYNGNITPRIITSITGVTSLGKEYDGNTDANVDTSGVVFGNIVQDEILKLHYSSASYADKNVGIGKVITLADVQLFLSDNSGVNENYSFSGEVHATANITSKAITGVTGITAYDKVYDGTTTATVDASGVVFEGMIAGDNLTLVYSTENVTFANKTKGTDKTVTVTGCSLGGTDAQNYTLVNTTASATANITPKPLTLDSMTIEKIYNASNAVQTVPYLPGVEIGDDLNVVGFYYTTADRDILTSNAGDNLFVRFYLGGTDSVNYTLTNPDFDNAVISKRAITSITKVYAADKTYNAKVDVTIIAENAEFGNKVASDELVFTYGSAAFGDKNVGTDKEVDISGIVICKADGTTPDTNYYLANDSLVVYAEIIKKVLTVSGSVDLDKVYDGTNTVIATIELVGIQSDEFGTVDTVTATGVYDSKNAGNDQNITFTLAGADKDNYVLYSRIGNIAKKELIIDIGDDQQKIYDGEVFSMDIIDANTDDLVAGDTISAGTLVSYSAAASATPYTLTIGTPITIKSGAINVTANYTIFYQDYSVTINKRTIAIEKYAINDPEPLNKVYDGDNSVIVNGKLQLEPFKDVDESGLVLGDNVHIEGEYVKSDLDLTPVKDVGTAIVVVLSIAGEDADNYQLDTLAASMQEGDITHKLLEIHQNPLSSITMEYYGGVDYTGTFSENSEYYVDEAVLGETVTVDVVSTMYNSAYVEPGNYLIAQFELASTSFNNNYKLTTDGIDGHNSIELHFDAEITVQEDTLEVVIMPTGGSSVVCTYNETIEAPLASLANTVNSFMINYQKGVPSLPEGVNYTADFTVFKLTKQTEDVTDEGNGIVGVQYGLNNWYSYNTNASISLVSGRYPVEDDALYYIEVDAQYVASTLPVTESVQKALNSIDLLHYNSFVKFGTPA